MGTKGDAFARQFEAKVEEATALLGKPVGASEVAASQPAAKGASTTASTPEQGKKK